MIDPALVLAWLDAEIADGQAEMAKQNSFADESFYSGEIMALKRARVHVAALAFPAVEHETRPIRLAPKEEKTGGHAFQVPPDVPARSGVITSGLRLTDEEDSKALWLTRRLMPQEPDR